MMIEPSWPPLKDSPSREEELRRHAANRVMGKDMTGAEGVLCDGTHIVDGVVVKLSPWAIVDVKGRVIGWRHE